MRQLLKKYRATIVSFLGLTVPLFLLYSHGKHRPPEHQTIVESAMMHVTGPFQRFMNGAVEAVSGVWHDYVALVEVKQDNARLNKRVSDLEGQALENQRLRRENERLLGLCELRQRRGDWETVTAYVISKDISPYYRVVRVVLDVGQEARVEPGMPVITHLGVVGRISQVAGRYADVLLTVDPRSRIDVKIAARGASGTVEGSGDRNLYGARFFFLERSEPIAPNDEVITSGHDRVFPSGLVVGYVASDDERQSGVYFEYDVIPAVNFSTLEEVLVILNERPEVPSFGGRRRR